MGFHFVDSKIRIIQDIRQAGIDKISREFYRYGNIEKIKNIVRAYVISRIKSSPTWLELVTGIASDADGISLLGHFGIPKGTSEDRLSNILDVWSNEIDVIPHSVKKGLQTVTFRYVFYAIRADWSAVLSLPAGKVLNDSANPKHSGEILPWLEWLLVDNHEINDYRIAKVGKSKRNKKRSRSGEAFMISKGSWKVPPAHAPNGPDDNFVTKVLQEVATDNLFLRLMTKELQRIVHAGIYRDTLGALVDMEI